MGPRTLRRNRYHPHGNGGAASAIGRKTVGRRVDDRVPRIGPATLRSGRPDAEVEAIIVEGSAKLGLNRRPIDEEEIVERMILPMINEGARILEEGIATRSGDIDVIWAFYDALDDVVCDL